MKKFLLATAFVMVLTLASFGQAVLPTVWNFSSPGISTPPAGWTLGLGTNGNLTYGFGIGDALSARLDATGEFITIQIADKPGELSYWLSPQNAGNSWAGQFDIQESANGTTWSTIRSITSKATTTTNFTGGRYLENLQATTRFVRFYYTTKLPGGSAGGGNMALDSVMIKPAPAPPTPGIQVKLGSNILVNGNTAFLGNSSNTQFSLTNTGTQQSLIIDSAVITGANASDFNLQNLPDTITATNSKNFLLNFTAGAPGTRKATLTLYSNDPDKPNFRIQLYAIGGNLASEPAAQASAISFNAIRSFAFNIQLDASNKPAEKFIVLKKLGSDITETPIDGISYNKGDYIGNAQVEYILDSSFTWTPNYILAQKNYHFAVFSFNGPAGFENYLTSNPTKGNVTTTGKTPGNYYAGIDPAAASFVSALSAKINPHDTIFYSNYISRLVNPWLARDTSGGKKVVTCVYTGHQFVYSEPFLWASGNNGAVLTREHTWPQSWMPSNQGNPDWPNAPGTNRELPEYNDLHNLFPAHQINANARRSNNPFHEVITPSYTSPTGFGMLGLDSFGITSYEPRPEQKGDVARALFYMAVAYNGVGSKLWSIPNQQSLNLLKQWHQMDPPDDFEIARNEFIAVTQKNRNPFIDFPEWVERINFRTMAYVPGDSIPPLPKSIVINSPTGSDIWKKGVPSNISYTFQNVDSVYILFSSDSMQTWINIASQNAAVSVNNNPFVYTPLAYFDKPYGVLIIKDKVSSTADTSSYFALETSNGVAEGFGLNQIFVYPNPVKDILNIAYYGVNLKNISMIDLQGREVYTGRENQINIQSLPTGMYIIKVETALGVATLRFVKQ